MANTILLMSDEHNPFVSSPHGHATVQTPNMQAMADRGAWFENAYCPSPLCTPSRSSFMSGMHTHQHRMYSNCIANTDFDHLSFGKALLDQGVHAVNVGKLGVYTEPERLGFGELILPNRRKQPGDVNHRRRPLAVRPNGRARADHFGPREGAFDNDEKKLAAALDWLARTGATMTQPWVMCINLSKPHFPHYVTPELWDLYRDAGDLPAHGIECESAQPPYAQDLRKHFELEHFTDDQIRGLRRGYYGCVTFVDQALGQLRDAIESLGLGDSTNLIYTSDHGEMLGKFGLWWKCSLHEDSVRVPMLATGPDFDGRGRVRTPVTLHDAQASFFRTTNAQRPAEWVGQPLQDVPDHDQQRVVFAEYHGHGTRGGAYMIRQGDWKLIYCVEGPNLLFNLADDPEESHNVHDAHPDKARQLEAHLRAICDPEHEDGRAHAFQEAQLAAIA